MLRLEEARELATHTLLVREEIEILLSLIKDAETGQRGFLLTGEAKYLEPYENGHPARSAHTDPAAPAHRRQRHGQQSQLVRLDGLIGAKLSEMATTIRMPGTRRGPPRPPASSGPTSGIRVMDRHPRAAHRHARRGEPALRRARDPR